MSIFSLFLALVGLGFLIFIHELGHFLMARRAGMRVDRFSIGFGRPIFSFVYDGVQFSVCWIPFGGYVKIAGMEGKEEDVPDGFFSKSPLKRIQVALWGPGFNILFALLAFSFIWITGGRERPYSEQTARVGLVAPDSDLYVKGVRPGDRIVAYNDQPVKGSKDHIFAAMLSGQSVSVNVENLETHQQKSFEVNTYREPSFEKGLVTTGVMAPASFLIWDAARAERFETRAQKESGIHSNDRLVWADGQDLFSLEQLNEVVNDNALLVNVERDGQNVHVRVPRVTVGEMRLTPEMRGELSDWKYAADLKNKKLEQIWFLPYNITSDCIVENAVELFDQNTSRYDILITGDRIVGVAGLPVSTAVDVLRLFQERKVVVVVDRSPLPKERLSVTEADKVLIEPFHNKEFTSLVQAIGTRHQRDQAGSFVLLKTITPQVRAQLFEESGLAHEVAAMQTEEQKMLEGIEDPEVRAKAMEMVQNRENRLFLGLIGVHDMSVAYNPNPFELTWNVVEEMRLTLGALFSGTVSPKWMSGPVGIVHVVQKQWSTSYKEALFWLGLISLNLAVLNLLPLPVLDGGYILLSLFEMVTGVRPRRRTIEKIVVPFAFLLIAFLIYLTYNDILRLISSIWPG